MGTRWKDSSKVCLKTKPRYSYLKHFSWRDVIGPLWTACFAAIAILDILSCWHRWLEGWTHGSDQSSQPHPSSPTTLPLVAYFQRFMGGRSQDDSDDQVDVCPAAGSSFLENASGQCSSTPHTPLNLFGSMFSSLHHILWRHPAVIGLIFSILCIAESIRRAREARQIALDMAALDEFEQKLAKLYSVTKVSVFQSANNLSSSQAHARFNTDENGRSEAYSMMNEDDLKMMRKFIRVWTPVVSTLLLWCILMPWPTMIQISTKFYDRATDLDVIVKATTGTSNQSIANHAVTASEPGFGFCYDDAALATIWIIQLTTQMHSALEYLQSEVVNLLWKLAIPFNPILQPIKLIQRLRLFSRWVRYFRYAGPLLRLILKLQDQFWVFTKTWRQKLKVQTEKAKRLAQRSILFQDIDRIESLTKLQTTMATLPSQLFARTSSYGESLQSRLGSNRLVSSASSASFYAWTANQLSPTLASSDFVSKWWNQQKEEGDRWKRRLDKLRTDVGRSSMVLSSSEIYDRVVDLTQEVTTQVQSAFWNSHLISPQTRFSVSWRIVVTIALLSELGRLYLSWHFSGSFDLRYHDLTRRLLGLCQQQSRPVRKFLGKALRLAPNHPWLDTCRQSSPSSQLSLLVAAWTEHAINLVGFLDILVWFYTGELDTHGLVIPKPFFSRCILPGTLIQVLDHPTVPQSLPRLISHLFRATQAVGYSRAIRWILAIYPALHLWIVYPLNKYLFRPMDDHEYLNYTESLGVMQSLSSTAALTRSMGSTAAGVTAATSSSANLLSSSKRRMAPSNSGATFAWDSYPSSPRNFQGLSDLTEEPSSDSFRQSSISRLHGSFSEIGDEYGQFYY